MLRKVSNAAENNSKQPVLLLKPANRNACHRIFRGSVESSLEPSQCFGCVQNLQFTNVQKCTIVQMYNVQMYNLQCTKFTITITTFTILSCLEPKPVLYYIVPHGIAEQKHNH